MLAQPSPPLSRDVFIHLWACQCDIVSALLKAIHLTFKPSHRLGPPADPNVPSDLLAGGSVPSKAGGGERAPLGGSPSWSQLSAPGRISAFCKIDSPFLKSLPAVYLPRVFYFYVFLHIQVSRPSQKGKETSKKP